MVKVCTKTQTFTRKQPYDYLVSVVNPAAGERDRAAPEFTVEPGLLSHSNLHLLWWV